MSIILAGDLHFSALRDRIEAVPKGEKVIIENCLGQRFIASGRSGVNIEIHGTPGNDLGSYLDGGVIEVFGNAQDATADTMNDGEIIIHGSSGDATGYAMRGGRILIEGNVGYRAGIHMKAYKNKIPVMVVGGRGGNFLAEYQAGGKIIVLGLHTDGKPIVGAFCGTGQHGGAVYLRGECPGDLPKQIIAARATDADMSDILPDLQAYATAFGVRLDVILAKPFFTLKPNSASPYKQLYTNN